MVLGAGRGRIAGERGAEGIQWWRLPAAPVRASGQFYFAHGATLRWMKVIRARSVTPSVMITRRTASA
jgi:hypothetical protein